MNGHRILLAEDNATNLMMMLEMLSIHSLEVIVARNGLEAVELAQTERPELILMDVRMPVMNGLEAVRKIREIPELTDTPIIALTASIGTEAEDMQLAAGCTEHLSKPIQTSVLFAALARYLD